MKKLMFSLAVLLSVIGVHAGDFGSDVPSTNRFLLGEPGDYATTYATGTTYAAGARIMTNNVVYVATVGGVAGAGPTFNGTADVSNGAVIWRKVLGHPRTGLIIVNEAATRVHVSLTVNATTNTGVLLVQNGSISLMGAECPQGAITAISESGLSRVGVTEW